MGRAELQSSGFLSGLYLQAFTDHRKRPLTALVGSTKLEEKASVVFRREFWNQTTATEDAFSHLSKRQRGSRKGSFSHCDTWYQVVQLPVRDSGTLYLPSTGTETSICHGTYSRDEWPRDGSEERRELAECFWLRSKMPAEQRRSSSLRILSHCVPTFLKSIS